MLVQFSILIRISFTLVLIIKTLKCNYSKYCIPDIINTFQDRM